MDIKLIRGDTYAITFKILTADGVPYAIGEGDKIYFTIKKTFNHKECVLQKTYDNGITYDSRAGEYTVNLTQICTCDLDCGAYVYDIKVILANQGEPIVETLVKGALTFENNATHKVNEQ